MATIKTSFQNPEYVNWIKAVLSLACLKKGLERFADERSKELHQTVLNSLKVQQMCINCTISVKKKNCYFTSCGHPSCDNLLDAIVKAGIDPNQTFTFQRHNLKNSNVQYWHDTHWEVAKLFMNAGQTPTQTGPGETDLSAIINFIDFCQVARKYISNTQNIKNVREARNSIMHFADMKLTNKECESLTQSMIDLLEDKPTLAGLSEAQDAVKRITEIMSLKFIPTEDERNVLTELETEMRTLHKGFRTEIEDIRKELLRLKESNEVEATKLLTDVQKRFDEKAKEIEKVKITVQSLEAKLRKDDLMTSQIEELTKSVRQTQEELQRLESQMKNTKTISKEGRHSTSFQLFDVLYDLI